MERSATYREIKVPLLEEKVLRNILVKKISKIFRAK